MTKHTIKGGLSRRGLMKTSAAAAIAIGMPAIARRANAAEPLYVNTWGGAWQENAEKFLFKPFTAKTGIEIKTISPVSYAKLSAQARTRTYDFDITTVSGSQAVQAKAENLIDAVDQRIIDIPALPAGSVFHDGVASHCYSTNIAYNTNLVRTPPQSWKDVWDVAKIPGPRSLPRSATDFVPVALMADGVPMSQVYPPDVERLFRSLDKIKAHVPVWWTQGPQSVQLLRDGEVHMTAIWHSTAQFAINGGAPIKLVWNQAKINRVYWVVSRGTPRAEAAWQFIKFATAPENLAGFCTGNNLSPLYTKAFEYMDGQTAMNMPTYPDNYKLAVEENAEAIGPMMTDIIKRFNTWIAT